VGREQARGQPQRVVFHRAARAGPSPTRSARSRAAAKNPPAAGRRPGGPGTRPLPLSGPLPDPRRGAHGPPGLGSLGGLAGPLDQGGPRDSPLSGPGLPVRGAEGSTTFPGHTPGRPRLTWGGQGTRTPAPSGARGVVSRGGAILRPLPPPSPRPPGPAGGPDGKNLFWGRDLVQLFPPWGEGNWGRRSGPPPAPPEKGVASGTSIGPPPAGRPSRPAGIGARGRRKTKEGKKKPCRPAPGPPGPAGPLLLSRPPGGRGWGTREKSWLGSRAMSFLLYEAPAPRVFEIPSAETGGHQAGRLPFAGGPGGALGWLPTDPPAVSSIPPPTLAHGARPLAGGAKAGK